MCKTLEERDEAEVAHLRWKWYIQDGTVVSFVLSCPIMSYHVSVVSDSSPI